jgi:phosphoserine phosphatase
MPKLLLVRHGHVEGIEPKRFRGRADLPLTSRGRAEASAVARRIASAWSPAAIYTSPLQRCRATAAVIGEVCRLEPCVLDDLRDIDYGTWTSRSYDEIESIEPQRFAAWLATPQLVRFPDGESLQDLVVRAADALRFVLAHHADETIVLVAHDSLNRALLLQLLDQPLSAYWRLDQSPCCVNEIDIAGGSIRILRLNDTAHLA